MASSPQWKVYNANKEYVASFKYPEDAACLIASYGEGATLRWGHGLICWLEGQEKAQAWNSYDYVTEIVRGRLHGDIANPWSKR